MDCPLRVIHQQLSHRSAQIRGHIDGDPGAGSPQLEERSESRDWNQNGNLIHIDRAKAFYDPLQQRSANNLDPLQRPGEYVRHTFGFSQSAGCASNQYRPDPHVPALPHG
jgi:hypothetical protein